VSTLGGFRLRREGEQVSATAWGREKALQLFQFLVTNRRQPLHKEQIIDLLWPRVDPEAGDRDFKVSLNAVNKVLEPGRPPRATPRFIRRVGLAYGLDLAQVWVDAEAFERLVKAGNQAPESDPQAAIEAYQGAMALYAGDYLPERRYEDWTAAERERLGTLALGTLTRLAGLLVARNPLESVRLAEWALGMDPVWEDAYRVLMRAYMASGNRPLALRSYRRCERVLQKEFGVDPLPETKEIYQAIATAG
jgi:DNA-binding SARP family transcriptional activator